MSKDLDTIEGITKGELREIVREEIERAILIVVDAKTTATAIEHGLFYSVPVLLPLHSKSARRRKQSSLQGAGL